MCSMHHSIESPWSSISVEEARDALVQLDKKVKSCTLCPDLAQARHRTVFGRGHPAARVVFIGEAPGFNEDRMGEPFVGEAGELLTRILASIQLQRDDVYIVNVLKCRPPQNRKPLPQEVGACRGYLLAQLKIIRPQIIMCLGSTAAYGLLGLAQSVSSLRGQIFSFSLFGESSGEVSVPYSEVPVLCTYHPAYLLRQPQAKKEVWNDMKRLRQILAQQELEYSFLSNQVPKEEGKNVSSAWDV